MKWSKFDVGYFSFFAGALAFLIFAGMLEEYYPDYVYDSTDCEQDAILNIEIHNLTNENNFSGVINLPLEVYANKDNIRMATDPNFSFDKAYCVLKENNTIHCGFIKDACTKLYKRRNGL